MVTSRLDRVFEEVKLLNPGEQRELGEMLKTLLDESQPPSIEDVNRKLIERGLITEGTRASLSVEEFERYTPVAVRGKPVSQTLIEERR